MTTPPDDAPLGTPADPSTDSSTDSPIVVSTAAPARSSSTSRPAPTRRSTPRRVGALAAVAVLAGGVLVGTTVVVERVRGDDEVTTADPSALFKTTAVASGSLTTSEDIDASVSLSETTDILHRIEGQSSSSVVGSGASAPGGSSAFPSGLMGTAAVESATSSVDPCASTSSTTTTSTTSAVPAVPPAGTAPTGSLAGSSTLPATLTGSPDTTDATSTTDSSTTTDAVTTTDTATTTTVPATSTTVCDTSTSSTTMPETTTTDSTTTDSTTTTTDSTTTLPGGMPSGGAPSGGGGATPSAGTGSSTSTSGTTARVTQTVTSVIEVGAEISLGDVLYTVEGTKVVAMAGVLPAWRSLDEDSDPGQDILQLELSLTALGYDPDGELTVDTEWDDATTDAVEAWQEGLGQEATGEVALGSIVFLPTVTTVVSVSATVGDEVGDGDTILSVSSPTQSVVIDVPEGTESVIVPGLVVSIGDVEGTVSYLRSVERDGSVVVQAVITPSAELEGARDGSTTSVRVVIEGADGVLLVPAEAIASKLDGSYAVQVSTDGTTNPTTATWVEVEVLGQVGTKVGVRGAGLTDGDEVLLPV